ncbi:MAG TPA: Gfo/Idh/MocA family oxidoreductase [Candidatus Sumerlaeota bacterium]|nr:Gfo/Idh/MocA family oxidoreductase [Candidatus Sumerlaeota bacterium]HOR28218.1 Gfo/Idh/MocA family oxidoreductase [Candidatus Sumerlaeota bacterium]
MSKIGVGMIGCGGIAHYFGNYLKPHTDRIDFRAFCDVKPEATARFRADFAPDARVYADYRDLVRDPDIDWVLIASWNCFHKEHAIAALEAGKDVFCQKPLATTLEDCLAIRDAWRASGRQFVIGFTLRFSPFYRKIKELLAGGAIGQIVSMEFNETLDFNHGGYIMANWRRLRRNAGTHLLEKCCHDVDLVNWFVESRARRVASFGGLNFFIAENAHHVERIGLSPTGVRAYEGWRDPDAAGAFTADKDIIDNQVAIIEFENNVRASFHTNCNSGIPERRMYIMGTEGALRADVLAATIHLRRIGFDTPLENVWDGGGAGHGHGGGDAIMAEELVAAMTERVPSCAGLPEGLAACITCFAIDEAMDTGRVVDVSTYWNHLA